MSTDIINFKIAVLSDLHCHAESDLENRKESFFIVGQDRIPPNRHPVQALLELIKKDSLNADVILCPGDITHKASKLGLSHAWDLLRTDVKSAFQANAIYCTLGNHDVTSRSTHNSPFDLSKNFHPDFPFNNLDDNNQFWSNGYCLKHINNNVDILIINTTYDHYNEENALRGTFDHARISSFDLYLKEKSKAAIRIALLHHHPVMHSFVDFTSSDVISTGDQLLDVLSKYKYKLIIHGHRHQPRIRRYSSSGYDLHIFCAGSFAAHLTELGTRTRNLFHLIDVTSTVGSYELNGSIKTWEYNYGKGWNPSSKKSAEFPHIVNIGKRPSSNLKEKIIKHIEDKKLDYYTAEMLRKELPDLFSLLPDEIELMQRELSEKDRIDLELDEFDNISAFGKLYP